MRKISIRRIIIAGVVIIALLALTRLEFEGFKFKTIVYPVLWIGIGIAGFKYYNTLRGSESPIIRSLLGLGMAFYLFRTWGFGCQRIMCGEINRGVLFINKHDNKLTLEIRSFECYGTTGDGQLYKVRNLTRSLKWVTEFNATPVDTTIWKRVR
ncbi:MAG TPA: hypothetical protein VFZ47_00585 [Chitinophagaceae bacterium]